MSAPWQLFPQNYGHFPGYYSNNQNTQQFTQSSGFYSPTEPYHQSHFDSLNSPFPEFDDQNRSILSAHGPNRVRRRVNAVGEHVKFRRTRSGCYTCRNRRVKCDEGKPVCERCRKGNRDCIYPEPPSSAKLRRDSSRSKTGRDNEGSSPDDGEFEDFILEDEEIPRSALEQPQSASSTGTATSERRELSDSPAAEHDYSPTPSTEDSANLASATNISHTPQSGKPPTKSRHFHERKYHELPDDIRFYLDFARKEMTNFHWGVRMDHQNFFLDTMLRVALRFDPLLYAVVGFAAYHYTLGKPDGKLDDFLGYYQHAVTLLLDAFKQRPTIATILTVLQLATIEEFLGDWVNLLSHQKAAYTLITNLYTPHRMIAHESLRKVLQWYIRFDVFVGILAGNASQLGREWFAIQEEFYKQQCKEHPEVLAWKYEERFAWLRLISFDVRVLTQLKSQGKLNEDDFHQRVEALDHKVYCLMDELDPAITDPSKRLADISNGRVKDPDDIVDPYEPNLLYGGDLFYTNVLTHDLTAFEVLYKNQILGLSDKQDVADVRSKCLKMCQIYEAVTLMPDAPKGIRIGLQAGLALSILWLRADEKEIWWARRKLADIERSGYTYPNAFRKRLEDLWGLEISGWWLPNDEGRPSITMQIRDFVQSQPSKDDERKIHTLKGIFESLNLTDGSSPDSFLDQSPISGVRPALPRQASAISTASLASSAPSGDGYSDYDRSATYNRHLAHKEGSEFELP